MEQTASARPRRRAAATATLKVMEGFAEEARPIDKKRRVIEEETKPKDKKRRAPKAANTSKKEVVRESAAVVNDQRQSIPGVANTIGIEAGSHTKPMAVTEQVDGAIPAQNVQERKEIPEVPQTENGSAGAKTLEPKTRKTLSRKRKTPIVEVLQETEIGKLNTSEEEAVGSRKNTLEAAATKKSSAARLIEDSRRLPLGETDMNITRPSTSPEKGSVRLDQALHTSTKSKPVARAPAEQRLPPTMTVKRRKVPVKCDAQATPTEPIDTVPSGKHSSADLMSVQVDTERKAQPTTKNGNSQQSDRAVKVSTTADEDIDWLFEKQKPKQPPAQAPKQSAPAARSRQRTKMADIDLDDLLSNIASFAKNDGYDTSGKSIKAKRKTTKNSGEKVA